MYLVSCCDIRCDFHIKTMFGSSLPPVVCMTGDFVSLICMYGCAWWCPMRLHCMNDMVDVILEHIGFTRGLCWGSYISSFYCSVFLFLDFSGVFFCFCFFLCVLFIFVLYVIWPLLPVSLNYSFLIAASCFSNIYLGNVYRCVQFLSHVIIIKGKVLLHQAYVTFVCLGPLVFLLAKTFKLFGF